MASTSLRTSLALSRVLSQSYHAAPTPVALAASRPAPVSRPPALVSTSHTSSQRNATSLSLHATNNKPAWNHPPTLRPRQAAANTLTDRAPSSRISTNQAQHARPNILYRPNDLLVIPSGAALGAYMLGVSLSTAQPLIEPLIRDIRTALVEHGVLIFPRQALSEEHLLRFTSYFGTPQKPATAMLPQLSNLPEFARPKAPQVAYVSNRGSPYIPYHSDLSFTSQPSMVTIFHCLQAPRTGGETKFASCYLSYQALPQQLKEELKDKTAVHRHPNSKLNPREPVSHPLFPVHPITKERVLYFSPYFTTKINGVSEEESQYYIKELSRYAALPQNVYTHFWAAGDLVVCDNRSTMHSREPFNDTEQRNMMRTYTIGVAPSLD